jgi:hypothetical protein
LVVEVGINMFDLFARSCNVNKEVDPSMSDAGWELRRIIYKYIYIYIYIYLFGTWWSWLKLIAVCVLDLKIFFFHGSLPKLRGGRGRFERIFRYTTVAVRIIGLYKKNINSSWLRLYFSNACY